MPSAWPDQVADEFVSMLSNVQAEVRTHTLHQHLTRHLSAGASILDVGGGDGRQSIPLARAGHHVTIVDPSPVMLAHATERLHSEPPEVAARVELIQSSGEQAPEVLGPRRFDAVLCHGVIMYVEDPRPLLTALFHLAEPGGLVSIVAKNQRALTLKAAHDREWKKLLHLFDADHVISGFGITTRTDTVEGLTHIINDLGNHVETWYGVYYYTQGTHSTPRNTITDDELTDILAAELEASQRDPFRQLSNLFHLIARRAGSVPHQ
jgi:S-adenosylmethionine-dependent methyltransferase